MEQRGEVEIREEEQSTSAAISQDTTKKNVLLLYESTRYGFVKLHSHKALKNTVKL